MFARLLAMPLVNIFARFEASVIGFMRIKRFVRGESYRSSHRRCLIEKGVLKNFTEFTGKHLCLSLWLYKVAGLSLQLYKDRDSGTGVLL